MNARRVEVTFSQAEWELLNTRRGRESRASFVKHHYLRALESALGGVEESEHPSLDHSATTPIRAPWNGEVRTRPDGVTERYVAGEGWVVPDPPRAPVVDVDEFAAGEVMDPPDRAAFARANQKLDDAAQLMWERQQRLNKGSASRKGKK